MPPPALPAAVRRAADPLRNEARRRGLIDMRAGLTAACLVLVGSQAARSCDLAVSSAWIRTPAAGATALAAYAQLRNTGSHPLRITAIESPIAPMCMLHETVTRNGVSTMRMLDGLTLAPGAVASLTPGHKHLMLMDPASLPKPGDQVPVSLTDARGCRMTTAFQVRAGG
jgi:copper(I)-binding protein